MDICFPLQATKASLPVWIQHWDINNFRQFSHFPLLSDLRKPTKITRTVYNYRKADWQGLKAAIIDSNLTDTITQHRSDVDLACTHWTNKFLQLINRFIPSYKIKNINSPPWIDGDVIHLSNKKETAHKRALQRNTAEAWSRYKRLRNRLKNLVNSKYHNFIKDISQNISLNPKRFWSLLRAKTKNKSTPEKVYYENSCAKTPVRKAFLFNRFFERNFSDMPQHASNIPDINEIINPSLGSSQITIAETRLILENIDVTKASGPDNISGRILKECAKEISPSLTRLFNLSLSLGNVPESWKLANVSPIFKKGDKENCSNYRPISLLCIVSKVLERAVLNQIKSEILPLITQFQHGFLGGRSTETQLLHVYNYINSILDSSGQADIIYLDFSKAFDSVPHHLLLHKLRSFGFNGSLYQWFSSYITSRKQRVVIDGEYSDWCNVTSWVPQGSILGPVLFLLYINDLTDCVSNNTNVALFADDVKIYREINSLHDCLLLQHDLTSLDNWSKKWKLNFNYDKCKVLKVARVIKNDHNYVMNNILLENMSNFNDLGINISSDLDWQLHIHLKVNKANSMLAFIKRTYGYSPMPDAKRMLYLTLIRSGLLYGSTVWYPNKACKKLLEGVQRRATIYILNDFESSYKQRLHEAKLVPLLYYK